jgi:hypothetical protein
MIGRDRRNWLLRHLVQRYLAEALPTLSAVEVDGLLGARHWGSQAVFEGMLAESGYVGK